MARILIIRFSALGDVAMTVPVVGSLARQYPQHEVVVLSRRAWEPLFRGLAANVRFAGADLKGEHRGVRGLNRLYGELKALRPDAVADFHHVLRSEYLADLNKDAGRHIRHIEKLAKLKGVGVTGQIVEGLPSAQVVKYIKDHSVDLLVLGPVNMIRSRREELTSESDRMLRTAPCPVLVSRDDEKLWQMFEE